MRRSEIPVQTLRRDTLTSFALLGGVVAIALVGLGVDGNWPKVLRLTAAFAAYAGGLVGCQAWPALRRAPSIVPFVLAGSGAGVVSGLARAQIDVPVLVAGTLAAALLLGPVHGLAVLTWRDARA
jgi:hypothetical protein